MLHTFGVSFGRDGRRNIRIDIDKRIWIQNGSAMKKSCIEKIGKAIIVVPEIF
ncbi:MAG: hypothetical protein V8S26_08770 [Lachnospiraceae bacterium]